MKQPIVTAAELEAKGFVIHNGRAKKSSVSPLPIQRTPGGNAASHAPESASATGMPLSNKIADGYDSDLERDFAAWLEEEKRFAFIEHWEREPESVRIAKRGDKWWRYNPDFKVLRAGVTEFYECKPNFVKKEARIGEIKLSLFAQWCKLWHYKLYRVTRTQGRWNFEELA